MIGKAMISAAEGVKENVAVEPERRRLSCNFTKKRRVWNRFCQVMYILTKEA